MTKDEALAILAAMVEQKPSSSAAKAKAKKEAKKTAKSAAAQRVATQVVEVVASQQQISPAQARQVGRMAQQGMSQRQIQLYLFPTTAK